MPAKEVADLIAMKRALAKYTPDIAKEMNTEIRVALTGIRNTARNLVPDYIHLRNFMEDGLTHKSRTNKSDPFPRYDPAVVRRGIVTKMGKTKPNIFGYVGFYSLINKSRAGALVETAGRGMNPPRASKSNNPKAREQFIRTIANDTGGNLWEYGKGVKQRGRIIYRAAVEDNGKVKQAILLALDKARTSFQSALDKAA